MPKSLTYSSLEDVRAGATCLTFIGRKERLDADSVRALLPETAAAVWSDMLEDIKPGDRGAAASTRIPGGDLKRVIAGVLPEPCSRHNSPARPHAVADLAAKGTSGKQPGIICVLDDASHAFAAGAAIARVLPLYSAKSTAPKGSNPDIADTDKEDEAGEVRVAFIDSTGTEVTDARLTAVAAGIRRAAKLVDMPTCVLNTDAFVAEAYEVADRVGAEIEVIAAEDLDARGFGGLWGVGKAAVHKPALVVLSHTVEGATENVVWVGKGIVYDTGGLSIKGKNNMPGMKGDMGGAAGVIGAFEAAVTTGAVKSNLYALLCLAENSVAANAMRPDDILHMYSGKTVEVNNTDAEGRLVLADGVAYAAAHLNPDVIVDMATLTGAQLVATGRRHCGAVCNDEDLEAKAVVAGKSSGDLVHALPYCPEFFRKEFKSKVADMKNSVKDRMNAQSSCAGQFIANHLPDDYTGKWLHLDIAGPADTDERGTGFGVALLVELFGESA